MSTPSPPPPPLGRTNYVLYGLLGVLLGLGIVAVILVATGDDDPVATASTDTSATNDTAAPTTTAATSTSTTTTTVPTEAPSDFAGDTDDKVAEGEPFGVFAFLADIRWAQREEGFTRVVFDYEGDAAPWWSIGYADGPFTNIGDEPVPVEGVAFIRIDAASTSFDLSGEEVRFTYEGPDRIELDTISVTEIVRIEDFEGLSTWIIGVKAEKPFAVGTLTDPARIYIDIQD